VHIHACLAVGQCGNVECRPGLDYRGIERGLDLYPGCASIWRAPDTACIRASIDDIRVKRVQLDVADAARRAIRNGVSELRGLIPRVAQAWIRPAIMDKRPCRATVGRLIQTPLRR